MRLQSLCTHTSPMKHFILLSIACLVLLGDVTLAQTNWPQFLGPHRNGQSAETGLLDQWPADGPSELWRVPGGPGMSGLSVQNKHLITMVQTEGKQRVVCLDAKTGKSIWQTPVADAYRNGQGNGPRATPTIAGDTAFAYTGEGNLVALQLSSGKILWSHNVVQDHGGKPADYGMASSPLVVGEQVVVIAGAPEATLVAYDRTSGAVAWTAAKGQNAGYSSVVLLNVGGREQLVTMTGSSVMGLDPKAGTILWDYPYVTDYDCNIALPVAVDGDVFISSGENHGCVLLKLTAEGDKFSVSEAWTSQGKQSALRNEWQTSVLIDDYLYGFDNVGSAGPVTHLTCVHAPSGERAWQKLRFGKGNLIAADGKLIIVTMKGDLVLVKASPDRFQELARAHVVRGTRQAPALANGLVYVRDDRDIVCFDMKSK